MRSRLLVVLAALVLAAVGAVADPGTAQVPDAPTPRDAAEAARAGRQAGAEQPNAAPRSGVAEEGTSGTAAQAAPGTVTYRVFTTQYAPSIPGSVEVAVPDKCAKFAALRNTWALAQFSCPSGYTLGLDWRVVVRRDNGRAAAIPVGDVGPWNLDDNYWAPTSGSRPRRLFGDLPRGTPEAQAAFYDDYNFRPCNDLHHNPTGRSDGADQFGRCVLNPAGLDLSLVAAAQLGLSPLQNEWVTVTFVWEGGMSPARPALHRRGAWYLRNSTTTGRHNGTFNFGNPDDVAVMGDWDGNGSKTPGVFRNGAWYLRNSNTTGVGDISFGFGNPGDLPVVGDWDGDGRDTPGLFRNGVWLLRNSNTTGVHQIGFGFGNAGDLPVVGDWDGDGRDTPGLFRNGVWLLRNSNTTGVHQIGFGFGNAGDLPVVGDWDGDRVDSPGLLRSGQWYVRNSNTTGVHEITFAFGDRGDRPLSWR